MRKRAIALLGLLTVFLGASACEYVHPEASEIGLYYNEGDWDGSVFDHCVKPGVSEAEYNDSIYKVPNSLRTWLIAKQGGDTDVPITVASAPEKDQPSGVPVSIWTQSSFMLNTYCGDSDDDVNSPVVQWWQKIGRRYYDQDTSKDKSQWWKLMLQNTLVPALETSSRVVARKYKADDLVAGTVQDQVQKEIAPLVATEANRLMGGEFFCGPDFDRVKHDCTDIQTLIKDVDYANPDIQAARDQKQKAVELAAAQVAEAEGKVKAAAAQQELYKNPQWLQLQLAQLRLEQVKACAASAKCTIVMGVDGQVMLNQG